MNEEELKVIWKKNENLSLGNIDFEVIKQKSLESQNKLRKRIKREVIANVIVYILMLPIFYFYPKILLLTPALVAVWVWYLWELKRIYRIENKVYDFANLKESLQTKKNILMGYFLRTRLIMWVGSPPLFVCSYYAFDIEEEILLNLSFLSTLLITELVVIIAIELYFRLIYRPYLDGIEDLLQQLDETQ